MYLSAYLKFKYFCGIVTLNYSIDFSSFCLNYQLSHLFRLRFSMVEECFAVFFEPTFFCWLRSYFSKISPLLLIISIKRDGLCDANQCSVIEGPHLEVPPPKGPIHHQRHLWINLAMQVHHIFPAVRPQGNELLYRKGPGHVLKGSRHSRTFDPIQTKLKQNGLQRQVTMLASDTYHHPKFGNQGRILL